MKDNSHQTFDVLIFVRELQPTDVRLYDGGMSLHDRRQKVWYIHLLYRNKSWFELLGMENKKTQTNECKMSEFAI